MTINGLQATTAVIQALTSVSLLAWFVLAAHLGRERERREKADEFDALVRLCLDLGHEAHATTQAHLEGAVADDKDETTVVARLTSWRDEMKIFYVCLTEVPHSEVRSAHFSTALTRLWLEVDAQTVDPAQCHTRDRLSGFLKAKLDSIGIELENMAALVDSGDRPARRPEQSTANPKRSWRMKGPNGRKITQRRPVEFFAPAGTHVGQSPQALG